MPGLEARDGKVGWGQWSSETKRSGVDLPGEEIESTTTYSLHAEFDKDYVDQNSGANRAAPNAELKKLFTHEIGHGFMLNHDPDIKQVMYYDISGEKEYTKYWQQIRAFFGR